MNYCLYCHEAFYEPVSWSFIVGLSEAMLFCEECTSSLQAINGEFCEICGRSFTLFPEQYRQKQCCTDCIRWGESKEWSGVVTKNRSLYVYNDFLKQIISTLKYRGDAKLAQGFRAPFRKLYKKEFRGMLIVPVPLSVERHYERGFNQAQLLAELLGGELLFPLERVIHEKSKAKSRERNGWISRRTSFKHQRKRKKSGDRAFF